jgi:hypothetical protein
VVLAIVAGGLVATVVTWPLASDIDGLVFGRPGDSLGTIWSLWRDQTQGFRPIGSTEVDLVGAPFGFQRNATPDLLSLAVGGAGWALTAVTDEVAAYNVLVLSGLALSGAAMYWLARTLGARPLPAAWAGLVFEIFPWHLERAAGAPSQTHLEAIPLVLIGAVRWHRRPSPGNAAVIVACLALGMSTDPYVGLMTLVVTAVALVVSWGLLVRQRGLGSLRGRITPLALGVAAVPTLVYGVVFASRGDQESISALIGERTVESLQVFGARLTELGLPAYNHPAFGRWTEPFFAERLHGSNFAETSLFLGWVTTGLAGTALVLAWRRRHRLHDLDRLWVTLGGALIVAGLVVSLRSPFPLGLVDVPLASEAVFAVAPYWRVYSRFVVLVIVGLILLGVFTLARAQGSDRKVLAVGLPALAIALSAAELTVDLPTFRVGDPPRVYRDPALRGESVIADYPLDAPGSMRTSEALFRQRHHGAPLLNGGPPGTDPDAFMESVLSLDQRGTVERLAYAGIGLVIVNGRQPAASQALTPIAGDARSRAYRVTAEAAAGVAVFRSGVLRGERGPRGRVWRWSTSPVVRMEIWARSAGNVDITLRVGSWQMARRMTIRTTTGQSAVRDVPSTGDAFTLRLRLVRGVNPVTVSMDPGPSPGPEGSPLGLYLSDWLIERSPA